MYSCIYFLMFILIPMSSLSHIYSLYILDISNFGLEKALKHSPNLVELKYVCVELIHIKVILFAGTNFSGFYDALI